MTLYDEPPPGPSTGDEWDTDRWNGRVARDDDHARHLLDIAEDYAEVDIAAVLAGDVIDPAPTVLTGGTAFDALLYRGRHNWLWGDSGSGKSWLALLAAAQQLRAGHHVVLVDLEAKATETVARLRLLGVTDDAIRERFHYLGPKSHGLIVGVSHVLALVELHQPTLVIIDSLGEEFAVDGIDENLDSEVGPFIHQVLRPIAELGPCVVVVDHATLARAIPLQPSGSKRKRASTTGAMYRVDARPSFSRESDGWLELVCCKDRHGTFKTGDQVARFHVVPEPGYLSITPHEPTDPAGGDSTTEVVARKVRRMLADAAELEGPDWQGWSKNTLITRFREKHKAGDRTITAALEIAVGSGFVVATPGPNRAQLHRPGREYDHA